MKGIITPWHLAYTLLGSVALKPSDKLFESCPFGHILECRGVASVVPVIIDKIEVNLDFHIFDILDFDLLIGYPLENLLQEKSLQGSINHDSGKTAYATPISCPEIPMVEHHIDHNPLEEMIHESSFVFPNTASPPDHLNKASLKEDVREEWTDGIRHFSEAFWSNSPSTIIPCSIQGIAIEVHHIPNMKGNIMP